MQKQEFDRLMDDFSFEERICGVNEYFQAAVLAPLVLVDGAYHFLFERRSAHIRQGGEICFPGGRIDDEDASPLETALRETQEELGCSRDAVQVIGRLDSHLMSYGSLIHAYLGVLSQPLASLTLAAEEVASVFTVPLSFFMENKPELYTCRVLIHPYLTDSETGERRVLLPVEELGLPDRYREPWGNAKHDIYVYRTGQDVVWGLTAKIVYDCVQRIRKMQTGIRIGKRADFA